LICDKADQENALPCEECPLRRCEYFISLAEELTFVGYFKVGKLTVEAGTTVLMKGSNSPQVYSVLSGLGTRSKMLEDAKRQVITFLLEGDFIGL